MNDDGSEDLEYHWGDKSLLQCSSSGYQKSIVSTNDENSIFSGTTNPRIVVANSGQIIGPSVACLSQVDCYYANDLLESQGVSGMSDHTQYPSYTMNIESVADVPCTSSPSFSGTIGLLSMAGYSQSSIYPAHDKNHMEDMLTSQKGSNSCKRARENINFADEDISELSPHRKRLETIPSTTTNVDEIPEKNYERNEKSGQATTANVHFKNIEERESSRKVDAPKDVKEKRGQATSAHSLAERLRREKINERMKYLQDLVPGCDKIIGKAVMLDEIINYVQSLQRQVEFLSMKLATAYPEMKVNIENLLLQDVHKSQDHSAALLSSYSAVTSACSIFPIDLQGQFTPLYNSNLHLSSGGLIPSVWHQGQNNSNQICSLSNPEPSRLHHE